MKRIFALLLVVILTLSAAALAEGKLVLYYSHAAEWSDPIIQGFEDKYDVDVELVSLGTGECLSRIRAEAANPQADIVWGGVVESYIPVADLLESYESTEIPNLYEGVYDTENHKWYAFDLEPMVMVYNTNDVAEAPTGWGSMLKEEYKALAEGEPKVKVTYTYYIQELVDENATEKYTVDYENNDGISQGTITMKNTLESPKFELPQTGGPGTRTYALAGVVLCLLAVTGLACKRRRGAK